MQKDIKKDVYEILNLLPTTRTSDKHLLKVYCEYKGLSTDFTKEGGITVSQINTITRCRRKHQEQNPNLYPKKIKEIREEERKEFKEEFSKNV